MSHLGISDLQSCLLFSKENSHARTHQASTSELLMLVEFLPMHVSVAHVDLDCSFSNGLHSRYTSQWLRDLMPSKPCPLHQGKAQEKAQKVSESVTMRLNA